MGCSQSKEKNVQEPTAAPVVAPVVLKAETAVVEEQQPVVTEAPVAVEAPVAAEEPVVADAPVAATEVTETKTARVTKIAIVYYSTYGHIVQMAEAAKEGVEKVAGVEATIYQVSETLDADVLAKMHAAPKKDYPVATPEVLQEADGILFGFPTRFGALPSQVKSLFDQTGGLWATGALVGKTAGFFFSTGTQAGGQETTAYTATTFLAHHGFLFVPLGYRSPLLFNMEEVHGGSPWGAGTLAGPDGSRKPSELELNVAKVQGESFAQVTAKLSA